jgi:hypothetical protein
MEYSLMEAISGARKPKNAGKKIALLMKKRKAPSELKTTA